MYAMVVAKSMCLSVLPFVLATSLSALQGVVGQTVEGTLSSPSVQVGSSLNFTLGTFAPGNGNNLTDIIAGYLMPGSCDMQPLAFWDSARKSMSVYTRLGIEAPLYSGRISIPTPRTMRINNISRKDQGKELIFRMAYTNPLTRTVTSDKSIIVVTDFTGVVLNISSALTKIEGDAGFTVSCTSSGLPTPIVYWHTDGPNGARPLPQNVIVTYPPTTGEHNTSLLIFPRLDRRFRGVYTCNASNFAHAGSKSLNLAIKSAPEVVDLNTTCTPKKQRKVCWSSPNDIPDSRANSYFVNTSTGASGAFNAPACLPNAWFSNATGAVTVSVTASNQYGSSPKKEIRNESCGEGNEGDDDLTDEEKIGIGVGVGVVVFIAFWVVVLLSWCKCKQKCCFKKTASRNMSLPACDDIKGEIAM